MVVSFFWTLLSCERKSGIGLIYWHMQDSTLPGCYGMLNAKIRLKVAKNRPADLTVLPETHGVCALPLHPLDISVQLHTKNYCLKNVLDSSQAAASGKAWSVIPLTQ